VRLGRRPLLSVTGLGPLPAKRKKRPPVELTFMGQRGRRGRVAVTCDGQMGLDVLTIHVRVDLVDLGAPPVTVTLTTKETTSGLVAPGWIERPERSGGRAHTG